jgi:hypothetical protein
MNRLLPVIFLLFPLLVSAQIYRTVDEEGNVVFTDRPVDRTEAQEIQLNQTNRVRSPEVKETPAPESAVHAAEPPVIEYKVAIISPEHESTIPMGPGDFSVSAMVRPSLGSVEKLQLLLDGGPQGGLQLGSSWNLTDVARGAHDIAIAVIDKNGEQIAVSNPTRVYVMRPSVNSPAN